MARLGKAWQGLARVARGPGENIFYKALLKGPRGEIERSKQNPKSMSSFDSYPSFGAKKALSSSQGQTERQQRVQTMLSLELTLLSRTR